MPRSSFSRFMRKHETWTEAGQPEGQSAEQLVGLRETVVQAIITLGLRGLAPGFGPKVGLGSAAAVREEVPAQAPSCPVMRRSSVSEATAAWGGPPTLLGVCGLAPGLGPRVGTLGRALGLLRPSANASGALVSLSVGVRGLAQGLRPKA